MSVQIDAHTKQLEQCYSSMITMVTKFMANPKDNTARASSELGSKMEEFETICDELCHIIEYNKQRLQANIIPGTEDSSHSSHVSKTNSDISTILRDKLETTKRLKQLLEDFTNIMHE